MRPTTWRAASAPKKTGAVCQFPRLGSCPFQWVSRGAFMVCWGEEKERRRKERTAIPESEQGHAVLELWMVHVLREKSGLREERLTP